MEQVFMTTIIGIHSLANKPPAGQLAECWGAAIRASMAGYEPYPNKPDDMHKADLPLRAYPDGWLDELRADASKNAGNALDFLKGKLGIEYAAAAVLEWKLKDLRRYYEEPDTREELRWRLKQAVKAALASGNRTMVISHSIGTINAFDALQELSVEFPAGSLGHWITIGSPLGLPHVVLQIEREWGNPRHRPSWPAGQTLPISGTRLRPTPILGTTM
jgi:hypothetical protein